MNLRRALLVALAVIVAPVAGLAWAEGLDDIIGPINGPSDLLPVDPGSVVGGGVPPIVAADVGDARGDVAAVSATGHAEGAVAASGAGDSSGTLVAVSALGDADAPVSIALAESQSAIVRSDAPGGPAISTCGVRANGYEDMGGERPTLCHEIAAGDARGATAVSATGDADSTFVGIGGRDAHGWVAAGALGEADSTLVGIGGEDSRGAVAASVFGDAEGDLAGVSVLGDASGAYAGVSGHRNASGSLASVSGRDGAYTFWGIGCCGGPVRLPGDGTWGRVEALVNDPLVRWLVTVETDGDAEGGFVGVSTTGSSRSCLVCVSNGVGSEASGLVAVSTRGNAYGSTLAVAGLGDASGDVAASGRGHAASTYVAITGDGDASGLVAAGAGDAHGRALGIAGRDATGDVAVAAQGQATCWGTVTLCILAVGGDGAHANNLGTAVAGDGDARAALVAATVAGTAHGTVAAAVTGDAYARPGGAAASGTGDAYGWLAASALGHSGNGIDSCSLTGHPIVTSWWQTLDWLNDEYCRAVSDL